MFIVSVSYFSGSGERNSSFSSSFDDDTSETSITGFASFSLLFELSNKTGFYIVFGRVRASSSEDEDETLELSFYLAKRVADFYLSTDEDDSLDVSSFLTSRVAYFSTEINSSEAEDSSEETKLAIS